MVKLKDGSTAKSRTRKVAAVAGAVAMVAGMVSSAAQATAADYPTSSFAISYGASYHNGTVTWYDRSVGVTGTFKAVGCRRANAVASVAAPSRIPRAPASGATKPGRRPFPL